jgi:hypothetical protein
VTRYRVMISSSVKSISAAIALLVRNSLRVW